MEDFIQKILFLPGVYQVDKFYCVVKNLNTVTLVAMATKIEILDHSAQ